MSIFINSKVHLPSSCEKCPFNYADMSAGFCTAASETIDTRTYGRKRHPDCPMVELPSPHGRLIDADRLIEYINKELKGDEYIQRMFRRIVKSKPTIIEAEVSE